MLGYDKLKNSSVYNIYIYSYSINTRVQFPAFLTSFTDDFKSSWSPTTVLGKMDPISKFKNTTRTLNLGFDIPNESIDEAKRNMQKIDALIKGMYPVYNSEKKDEGMGTYIISSPPMFRVKFANLIYNASKALEDPNISSNSLDDGLLCYIPDFKFNPDIPSGFFINSNEVYPKLIKVSLTINAVHEHPLGNIKISEQQKGATTPRLQKDNSSIDYSFPHGYDNRQATKDGNSITTNDTAMAGVTADAIKNGILS